MACVNNSVNWSTGQLVNGSVKKSGCRLHPTTSLLGCAFDTMMSYLLKQWNNGLCGIILSYIVFSQIILCSHAWLAAPRLTKKCSRSTYRRIVLCSSFGSNQHWWSRLLPQEDKLLVIVISDGASGIYRFQFLTGQLRNHFYIGQST